MKSTIYVPDIECDSCVVLIQRKFSKLQGIEHFRIHKDHVDVDHDDSLISQSNIIESIQHAGFRASVHPFSRKSWKERVRHFKENKKNYHLELKGMEYGMKVFIILVLLETIAYFGFLHQIPDFLINYGWWLFYLTISVVFLGMSIWHFYSHRAQFTCMVGMMIGMTIGMQTGMMIGAIVGATNGFFVGSMVGMILGSAVGWLTGRSRCSCSSIRKSHQR